MTDFQAVDLDAVLDQFEFHEEEKEEVEKKKKESFDKTQILSTHRHNDDLVTTFSRQDETDITSELIPELNGQVLRRLKFEFLTHSLSLFLIFCDLLSKENHH